MAFGLGQLFYFALLLVNAVAVLSEDRFLGKIGWSRSYTVQPQFGNDSGSVKAQIINLIAAVRTLLRIPLIIVNTIVIVYELILG